jgi:DNA-binding NarL/FixJ family response regulator
VEALMRGESFFTPMATEQMLALGIFRWSDSAGLKPIDDRITSREHQVLQLLTEGKSTKEVGIALKIRR